MNHKFLPTVTLTPSVRAAVEAGTLDLRPGQWVRDPLSGRKGQVIHIRNRTLYVSWTERGEDFDARTQRFCRAVWHQRRKCRGPVTAVLGAPRSVNLQDIKGWFAKRFDTFAEAPL